MDPNLQSELSRQLDAIRKSFRWLVIVLYAICLTAVAAALWS